MDLIKSLTDRFFRYVAIPSQSDAAVKTVPTSKGKAFAEEHNMIFYETSAKTGAGVKELFQAIAAKEYEIMKDKD